MILILENVYLQTHRFKEKRQEGNKEKCIIITWKWLNDVGFFVCLFFFYVFWKYLQWKIRPEYYLSLGEGNGNPLQCSCLENPRDGWVWWAAVYGVAQSQTRLKQLRSSSSIIYPFASLCIPEGEGRMEDVSFLFLFYIHSFSSIFFSTMAYPRRLEYSSLCYTVGPCPSILNAILCIC